MAAGVTPGRLAAALCAAALVVAVSASPAAADPVVVTDWRMNEPAGATVMNDSGPNGIDGAIVASNQITTGFQYDGATGYHWLGRNPIAPPPQPERVIQVPDDNRLDLVDPSRTYILEFRYRTSHSYGNILQKGQSGTVGGQIKVQNPGGTPQCLFKGASGVRVGTGSRVRFDDNQWHTVRCVRTPSRVTMFVDNVQRSYKNGATGPINNTKPFAVGGKISCDQVNTTCDYFSGDLDYIRISTE